MRKLLTFALAAFFSLEQSGWSGNQ